MSTVYILCKEDRYRDNIESIIKIFSNRTKALKELYTYAGLNDGTNKFNMGFFILIKNIDEDSYMEDEYEHVHHFMYINKYITKDIWQKVIDELPNKKTLTSLISFESKMKEYLKQEKKISDEMIENKKNNIDIRKELNEKLNELNIKMPEFKLE